MFFLFFNFFLNVTAIQEFCKTTFPFRLCTRTLILLCFGFVSVCTQSSRILSTLIVCILSLILTLTFKSFLPVALDFFVSVWGPNNGSRLYDEDYERVWRWLTLRLFFSSAQSHAFLYGLVGKGWAGEDKQRKNPKHIETHCSKKMNPTKREENLLRICLIRLSDDTQKKKHQE